MLLSAAKEEICPLSATRGRDGPVASKSLAAGILLGAYLSLSSLLCAPSGKRVELWTPKDRSLF